jgi:hypothetical protein
MIRKKLIILTLALLVVPSLAFSQLKCLYVCFVTSWDKPPDLCIPVYEKFEEWGYEMTYVAVPDIATYTQDDYEQYDFMFIDEWVDSATLEPIDLLEGHPIPVVTTENYSARGDIFGFRGDDRATNIPAELVEIVADGHPLAAGFNMGDRISINDGGGVNEDLIKQEPIIDSVIPVAVSTSDPDGIIVYGVEAGGQTVNGVDIKNRAAVCGYHANGYAGINDNGFLLLKAAIDWVTEGITSVEEDPVISPETYALAQNFPNPFNPETTIEFRLEKPGHTIVSVYNALGQLVTKLVDEKMNNGIHHVTFFADNNPAGIYFYKIESGDFSKVRKMLLLK